MPKALIAAGGVAWLLVLGGCPLHEGGTTDPPAELTVTATGPASVSVDETATLTATVGDAAAPLALAWAQLAGPPITLRDASTATAQFTGPSIEVPRLARFRVTVTDARGATGTATVEVIVNGDPLFGLSPDFGAGQVSLPVARAGDDRDYGDGDLVELDGSASSGAELRYSWTQTGGADVGLTGADQAVATFTAPALGADNEYMFELTVTDAFGQVATDVVTVTVIERPEVEIETTLGSFTVRLEPGRAPKTVANFLQYVADDFYPGTIFHRVISDFVIQGGGFEPGLERKVTRAPIELEADNGLSNTRGTIAMARTSEPNSAAAQFYVNLVDNSGDLDPSDDSPGYTVFGEVIAGLDVVDAIGAVATESVDGFDDVPETDVVITDVARVN